MLVGCGAASTTGGTSMGSSAITDPLNFQNSSMPAAYVGETFTASVAVLGGVGPYGYRVISGSLPPGLKLSGANLSGTPTTAGPYKFTVEVSDANLSNKVMEYTLNVNELPPLSIEAELPQGQIRGETRIPLQIKAARGVRAARVTWDLGPNVKVSKIQLTDSSNLGIWKQSGQILTLDMGFKTVPRSGTRIALITVKPGQTLTLNNSNFWYDSRDGTGKVLGEKKPPAPAPDPKVVDPKAADPAKTDPAKADPTKTEPAKTEPAKTEPATTEPAKTDPATADPAKTPAPTSDPPKTDPPKTDLPPSGGVVK